jgi:hypothetical protein
MPPGDRDDGTIERRAVRDELNDSGVGRRVDLGQPGRHGGQRS